MSLHLHRQCPMFHWFMLWLGITFAIMFNEQFANSPTDRKVNLRGPIKTFINDTKDLLKWPRNKFIEIN